MCPGRLLKSAGPAYTTSHGLPHWLKVWTVLFWWQMVLPHGPVVEVNPDRQIEFLVELRTAAVRITQRPVPLPTREMRLREYRLEPKVLLGPLAYPHELRLADARRA